jgi:hypothetical protein
MNFIDYEISIKLIFIENIYNKKNILVMIKNNRT